MDHKERQLPGPESTSRTVPIDRMNLESLEPALKAFTAKFNNGDPEGWQELKTCLHEQCIQDSFISVSLQPAGHRLSALGFRWLDNDQELSSVLTSGGSVVAYCLVARHGQTALVNDIAVAPAWQGRKLGSWLLNRAISDCRAAGIGTLELSVQQGNPARRIYERAGFHDTAGFSFFVRPLAHLSRRCGCAPNFSPRTSCSRPPPAAPASTGPVCTRRYPC